MKKSKFLLTLIALVTIVGIALVFWTSKNQQVSAAWWNDSWGYRNAVPVTAHTVAEANVYVSVTVNSSSNFQADCGDTRWTDVNGKQLDYYIVSGCGGVSTVVHVFLESFPAGAQTLYYYYGNPAASNGFSAADFGTEAANYTIGSAGSQEKAVGPVVYWRFDDGTGTTAQDSTTNNNDGSISGATWQTEDMCVSGKCLKFDGTDDYVSAGTANGVQTVSFWVKPASASASLVQLASGIDVKATLGVVGTDGFTSPLIYVNGNQTTTFTANQWNFVTVTTGAAVTANSILLGKMQLGVLNGFLDEVKFYNYARSSEQIKADYQRGLAKGGTAVLGAQNTDALNNGLVGYWKMDESSTPSMDTSGLGSSLTWLGNAISGSGKFGNGISLDGTGDYTYCTDASCGGTGKLDNDGSGGWSFGAWVKTSTATNPSISYTIISKWGGYELLITYTGAAQVRLGGDTSIISGAVDIADQQWHHVFATYQNSQLRLYVDNALAASSDSSVAPGGSGSDFYVGSRGGSYDFPGIIDEVRVYNRALSPAEVTQLYNFAPGPVAYYKFDEGTGSSVSDVSGNGNTGSWNGTGSRWGQGKFGKAGSFNGSSDYISVGSGISPTFQNRSFTFETWAYFSGSGDRGIASIGPYGTDTHLHILRRSNKAFVGFYDDDMTGTASLTSDVWWHVAITWDSVSKQRNIYLNGVLDKTGTSIGSLNVGTNSLSIGLYAGTYHNGKLDEVKIYNYVRTQKQIIEDMNGGHPAVGTPVGSTVGHWSFDEGSGTVANDQSPQRNNGTINGAVWSQNGKFGKALQFDGNDDKVQMSTALITGTGDYSISSWIYRSGTGTVDYIAGNYGTGCASGVEFYVYGGAGGEKLYIYTSSSVFGSTSVSVGVWHHVLVTRRDGVVRLYLDGREDGSGTLSASIGGSCNWTIGNGPNYTGEAFGGLIDEVKVYNFALTAEEVKTEYNRGSGIVFGSVSDTSGLSGGSVASNSASAKYCVPGDTTSCAVPVAEWEFNEGQGSTVADSSGNGNTGTWNGTGSRWTNGKFGKAGKFNGSDDHASITTLSPASMSPVSVFAWVYPTSNATTAQCIVSRSVRGWAPVYEFCPYVPTSWDAGVGGETSTNGKLGIYLQSTQSYLYSERLDSEVTIPLNQWSYIGFTFDGSSFQLYYNGRQTSKTLYCESGGCSETSHYLSSSSYQKHYIGAGRGFATDNPHFYFSGKIDQVRVFNYARSAAQVAWDYNRGKPVAHWDFDECQGVTAYDKSGNGNHGTLTLGGGTQTTSGTCVTSGTTPRYSGRSGKFNASLNFDGGDDYVSVADANSLDLTTGFTLSVWAYQTSTASEGDSVILSKGLTGSLENYSLYIKDDGTISIEHYNGGWQKNNFTVSSFSLNRWYHYVVTYDGSSLKAFRDGMQVGMGQSVTNAFVANSGTLQIGGVTVYNNRFQGQLDDLRIYNYALTPVQIKQLINDGAGVRFGPSSGTP